MCTYKVDELVRGFWINRLNECSTREECVKYIHEQQAINPHRTYRLIWVNKENSK